MSVLGIETATSVCGAAVVSHGIVVAEAMLDERNIHAEKLLTLIHQSLSSSGISAGDLEAIAVSIGPGSFTGLRIGLSVAKGLAFGLDKPLVPVPTLEALAMRITGPAGHALDGAVLAALDARRDELYCQLFTRSDAGLLPVWNGSDMTVERMLRELNGRDVLVTGDARAKIIAALEGFNGTAPRIRFAPPDLALCSAGTVAQLGEQLLARGGAADASTLEPRYIKEFFLNTPQR